MFNKTEEPLDADDWLQTMENNLEVKKIWSMLRSNQHWKPDLNSSVDTADLIKLVKVHVPRTYYNLQ
jgi:hypothetical protein